MTCSIRPEQAADHAQVFEIHSAAFGRRNEALLVDRLREVAEPRVSLVAERDGRVVGHVFFSPLRIDAAGGTPAFAGLAPLGVEPASQGTGVGSALVRAGLAAASECGWRAVFLVGDPRYYGRFGFSLAAPLGFRYGSPVFDAALQVHVFSPEALEGYRGRVCFHPVFVETGCG